MYMRRFMSFQSALWAIFLGLITLMWSSVAHAEVTIAPPVAFPDLELTLLYTIGDIVAVFPNDLEAQYPALINDTSSLFAGQSPFNNEDHQTYVLIETEFNVIAPYAGTLQEALDDDHLCISTFGFRVSATGTEPFIAPPCTYPYVPPAPPTPDNPFNFLGSTTPADLIQSVTTGVQDTAKPLWPLFAVMGIPMAFWIGRGIMLLIKF